MAGTSLWQDALDAHPDLERLYRDHRDAICAYVHRGFGGGPPSPEEIAQDAFLRLAQHRHRDDIANPKAFLLLTARNLAIDAQRRSRRETAVLASVAILAEDSSASDAASDLSARQELQRLAAAVDTLKPKERVVFLMHRIDGLGFSEIARRLGISASGARLLADRAFARCVAQMAIRQDGAAR